MLTVYASPVSLYCAKLRIVLRHKGLDWHEVPAPGGHGSADYLAMVPTGTLPALDHDGVVIGDSEAIAEYIEDVFPDPPLLPPDPVGRARARELARFHDTRLEPEVRTLFAQVAPANRDPTALTTSAERITARLTQLSALLGQPGIPENLSLGDCGLPVAFEWIEALDTVLGLGIDRPAPVLAYAARVGAAPAVRDELIAYRPAMQDWLTTRMA